MTAAIQVSPSCQFGVSTQQRAKPSTFYQQRVTALMDRAALSVGPQFRFILRVAPGFAWPDAERARACGSAVDR